MLAEMRRQGRKVKIVILNPAEAQYQCSNNDTKITILDILLFEDIFRYTISVKLWRWR